VSIRRKRSKRSRARAIREREEHSRFMRETRPDIDWDAVAADWARVFGPPVVAGDKGKSRTGKTAVYLMSATDNGPTKVGVASNVGARLAQLQTGHPTPLRICCVIWFTKPEAAFAAERWLLEEVNPAERLTGEWIDLPTPALIEMLQNFARRHLAHFIIPAAPDGIQQ
jgi:hypothetical protein